jgi:alcohol dehydrogenase
MIPGNPVTVVHGDESFSGIPELVGNRSVAIVATAGAARRGTLQRLNAALEGASRSIVATTTGVESNPSIESIQRNAEEIVDAEPQVLIAIGGGSTLDSAKGIAAIAGANRDTKWFSDHLRKDSPFPAGFAPPRIIAIPTTAGTGSEVTMWGTVWDEVSGDKYSISHPSLYPEFALMIPELTLSAGRELTLFTALDALSHCMESMWSTRSTGASEEFASSGMTRVLSSLDAVLSDPGNLDERRNLQEGALLAGYAISFTRTALAHSMSYPMTSALGMPHGLACSFTLPALMRFNESAARRAVERIAKVLGAEDAESAARELERRYAVWDVPQYVSRYADAGKVRALADRLITPGRADNNARQAGAADALALVLESLPA